MPLTSVPSRRVVHAAGLLLSTTLFAAAGQAPAPYGPQPVEGCAAKAVPAKLNFTLKDADDKKVKLVDYKGKVIVLNFWATWCEPCGTEIPEFVELQKQYEPQGVQFIGISIDDTPARLRPYIAEHPMNYPVLQGRSNEGVIDAYGPVSIMPTTILIKRDGNLCKRFRGAVTKDALEHELKSLLH
jgi:peroxiredoxin